MPVGAPARIVGASGYTPNDLVSAGVTSTSAYSCPVVALSLYAVISCIVPLKPNLYCLLLAIAPLILLASLLSKSTSSLIVVSPTCPDPAILPAVSSNTNLT